MMPVTAPAPLPLAIDRVERSRAKQDQVRLRLTGRWLREEPPLGEDPGSEALLVVHIHGRRHRFAAAAEDGEPSPGFSASFTLPDWAVPEQPGQAVLWVGDDVVPVPPPGVAPARSAPDAAAAHEEREVREAVVEHDPGVVSAAGEAEAVHGRSGPLADLLFKETVTALHAELEQRTAEVARLRVSLAQAESAAADATADPEVASTHAELRAELRRLMEAVDAQRREFDAELAEARTALADSRAELEGVRTALADAHAELEGVRAELQQARADRDAARGELESRLASARAEFDQQLAAARAEGESAVAAARHEAEAELEHARQETETMLAAARGHAEGRAEAAEAEARELAARLREHAAGERRRSEEAAILREQLAAAHVARDAALAEADGLRGELERLAGELAVLRERSGHAGDELSEARQLLADARALTERLRGGEAGAPASGSSRAGDPGEPESGSSG